MNDDRATIRRVLRISCRVVRHHGVAVANCTAPHTYPTQTILVQRPTFRAALAEIGESLDRALTKGAF